MSNFSSELTPEQVREKITICTVDDFATICNILKGMLGRIGFNPKNIVAIYGSKASSEMAKMLDVYKSYEPELSWKIPKLLFLDWNMPGMSGLDLLKKIRESDDPRVSNIIVVMVTAEAMKENVILAVQSGVDNYITKPLNQEIVEKKLKEISSKILRKAEKKIEKSPDKINDIVETINNAIAMDLKNDKALQLKRDFLGKNKKEVVKIVGTKVVTGKSSADEGRYSKALGEFSKALELNPSDPRALMEYGKMMMKKTLYEDAVKSFESALKFLKDNLEAQQMVREVDLMDLLGDAQLKLSMILDEPDEMAGKAIKTLERASKLYEEEKDEEGQARSLGKIGNVHASRAEEAEKEASKTKDTDKANSLKEKARGHNEKALSGFENALKSDAKQSASLIKLAEAYRKAGKEDKALDTMKKAEELKPDEPEALIEFGRALLEKGDRQTALSYFNSAKEKISVEDIELYEAIIVSLLEHDLPDESIPFIRKTAGERPDLYNNLGLAYRRKNRFNEAIEAYEKAITKDLTGDRISYLFNQGMAYKLAGNVPMAVKNLFQVYKTDNTFQKAAELLDRNCIELCNKAVQFLKKNDTVSATRCYKLAYVANQGSQAAMEGLKKLSINHATILTEHELKQLGINDPSAILEDFGA